MVKLRESLQYIKRVCRAMGGTDLLLGSQLACDKMLLGNELARWCVCPSGLSAQSVVYSFGVGQDISFELELVHRFGLIVHAFDPTPRALAWIQSQHLPPQLIFHDYGVADFDGLANFIPPENPNHVSYTVIARSANNSSCLVAAPVRSLRTIMNDLGHRRVDLLKMDIEGGEYSVLRDITESALSITQLLVEFHHRWSEIGLASTNAAIRQLNQAGYFIFSVAPSGGEYSFLRLPTPGDDIRI